MAGHLIAEATDTGTTVREYVWLDDMPLAVVADVDTPMPNLYYVHVDHLNRPIEMTDTSKNVVWKAVYWPYGEVYSITGSASNNLRFPGQYFLLESGLAYNWHRHYDPTLGRYTQPDPLGLVNGPSIYAYAKSSPGMRIDPTGRQEIFLLAKPWWLAPQRLLDPLRTPEPPLGQPNPPGWTADWQWRCPEGTSNQPPRWFDPKGANGVGTLQINSIRKVIGTTIRGRSGIRRGRTSISTDLSCGR